MDLRRGSFSEMLKFGGASNVAKRISQASPQQINPYRHPACNGPMILHDFMGLGVDHFEDLKHAEHASKLHPEQLHDAQGSTFGVARLELHHLENRHLTMDDDVQVDLELRLGVCPPEDRHTSTDESRVEPVEEVHEARQDVPVQVGRSVVGFHSFSMSMNSLRALKAFLRFMHHNFMSSDHLSCGSLGYGILIVSSR